MAPTLDAGTEHIRYWHGSRSMRALVAILGAGSPQSECWEWKRTCDRDGYGRINFNGREGRTHRAAWLLVKGEIPAGLQVLHRCDNPPCVNPSHLFLGTSLDNNRDCKAKGRTAKGTRNGTHTCPESRPRGDRNPSRSKPWTRPRGSANGMSTHWESRLHGTKCHLAKLTESDIPTIRAMAAGPFAASFIADFYGVSFGSIRKVIRRATWKHVP